MRDDEIASPVLLRRHEASHGTNSGCLARGLVKTKPRRQSLATFVREILEQERRRRRRTAAAADRYTAFLAEHADERASLAEWERADRLAPPRSVA
jgi:hypothetical protein